MRENETLSEEDLEETSPATSLDLLARIKSDLDTRSFTWEAIDEALNAQTGIGSADTEAVQYKQKDLDYLVRLGLVEYDPETESYSVTDLGYRRE